MHRFFAATTILLALAGCQGKQDTSDAAASHNRSKGKYRIAVIPKGTTHEFWKSVHYGAEQAAREFGAEVLWLGPQLEQDREGQISVVQNFVTQHVDGICLAPIDSQALVTPVKESRQEGIPVLIFDSGLNAPEAIVSYVATDNRNGGRMAAEEMARRLKGQGNVLLLRYMAGSDSTYQREEGFLETIKNYPGLTVLSSDQYSGDTPEKSLDKAQQMLNKFGDQTNGMFAVCEANAAGTLKALQEAELTGKVVFIGFDPNQRMVQALRQNEMQGIVLQDPIKMGYLAVKTMVRHLNGEKVESQIGTGETIATPENIDDPTIAALLAPPQFQD